MERADSNLPHAQAPTEDNCYGVIQQYTRVHGYTTQVIR